MESESLNNLASNTAMNIRIKDASSSSGYNSKPRSSSANKQNPLVLSPEPRGTTVSRTVSVCTAENLVTSRKIVEPDPPPSEVEIVITGVDV
jgi:hypothetical protein